MFTVRPAQDRGHIDHGWLDTYHSFSFGAYRDPEHMGFRSLRVINEDIVAPAKGFDTHPHDNMEILTYIVSGALEHRDSLDNGSVLRPGEIQRMSAGRGIQHSEFNPSDDEPVHLLQIWILPAEQGLDPSWEQADYTDALEPDAPCLLAAPFGQGAPVGIHQDARLYTARLGSGAALTHEIAPGRHAWVQLVRGGLDLGAVRMGAGDGCAVSDEARISITASGDAEFLLFDLG